MKLYLAKTAHTGMPWVKELVNTFAKSMKERKKILVICPHPVGHVPGQRLKYEQYFTSWKNNGYDIEVRPFMSPSLQKIIYKKGFLLKKTLGVLSGYFKRIGDLRKISQHDLVYIFLYVTPLGSPFFEKMVCKRAKKVIYDIDDLVFLKNDRAEPWYALLLKGRNKPAFLMKHANHVITCTPFLDEYARQFNKHTTDISSTINTETYLPVNKYENTAPIVLGWSGSHSTIRMLKTIMPVFEELKTKLKFKMLIMGSTDFELEGVDVETIEWSEEKEIPTLQRMDIGLYALPVDEEWVKGKSGLKALQYMALGIPTVATNVGCTDRVIENGVTGFLVNSHNEWVEKILLLASNPDLRRKIGTAAREKVEKQFSIKANEQVYLSILNNAVNNN